MDGEAGGAQFIRLKPAVHGNYQTKRTDNSTGRESLYINSFCSPTRSFRRRKVKFGPLFSFSEPFVFKHLSFRNTLGSYAILSSSYLHNAFLHERIFCHLKRSDLQRISLTEQTRFHVSRHKNTTPDYCIAFSFYFQMNSYCYFQCSISA